MGSQVKAKTLQVVQLYILYSVFFGFDASCETKNRWKGLLSLLSALENSITESEGKLVSAVWFDVLAWKDSTQNSMKDSQ